MNQEQVDVVGAQAGEGLICCLEGLLVTLVVVPDLGGEEDILASYAGVSNCLAGALFVAVDFGGVDVAVTGVKGQADDLFGGVVFYLPDAVAQLGMLLPSLKVRRGDSVTVFPFEYARSHPTLVRSSVSP